MFLGVGYMFRDVEHIFQDVGLNFFLRKDSFYKGIKEKNLKRQML